MKIVFSQIIEQLGAQEMNLTKIGKPRPSPRQESMLDPPTRMRVSFNSIAFDQIDVLSSRLTNRCSGSIATLSTMPSKNMPFTVIIRSQFTGEFDELLARGLRSLDGKTAAVG